MDGCRGGVKKAVTSLLLFPFYSISKHSLLICCFFYPPLSSLLILRGRRDHFLKPPRPPTLNLTLPLDGVGRGGGEGFLGVGLVDVSRRLHQEAGGVCENEVVSKPLSRGEFRLVFVMKQIQNKI